MTPLVGLVALACTAPQIGLPANSSNVQYRTMASGTDLKTNSPGLFLFNEPNAWENYWSENHQGPRPFVTRDFFQKWRLLAIHAGNRPTSGYGIGVQKIVRRIDKATIFGIESIPPRGSRNAQVITSPWVLLQVERGAFDFQLQTQRFEGYAGTQSLPPGSTVKVGGATVIFGPGYSGCDHCDHYRRGNCRCEGGRDCDCRRG